MGSKSKFLLLKYDGIVDAYCRDQVEKIYLILKMLNWPYKIEFSAHIEIFSLDESKATSSNKDRLYGKLTWVS